MKTTILLIAMSVVLVAAETKKPTPLNDKQQAEAAKAAAKMQSAIRAFTEASAAREIALKSAQEAAQAYQRIEADLRKVTGAPASCRLDEEMAWVRDVPQPNGQSSKAPCEIEVPKAEVKK